MAKHAYSMWQEITPDAHRKAQWLPFIIPFLASSYSEKGKMHLALFGRYFFMTMIFLVILITIKEIMLTDIQV